MLIQTTAGMETFRLPKAGSVEIKTFYKKDGKALEAPIFVAAKDRQSGCRSINSPEFIPASNRNANHGQWVIANYAVVEGSLLKVMIKKRFAGTFTYSTAQFMLLMRERSPLRRMRIGLTENPEATMTAAYYEGRFEYIRPEHFDQLGISYNASYLNQFAAEPDEFYTDEILEAAIQPFVIPSLQAVVQATGKTVHVPKPGARRVLNIRRP